MKTSDEFVNSGQPKEEQEEQEKLRQKACFRPIKSLFSFSTAQTEKYTWKKFVKQIGETI